MLSAHAATALVLGSIVFTSSALAGPSVDAKRLDEARRALGAATIPERDPDAYVLPSVAPVGLGIAPGSEGRARRSARAPVCELVRRGDSDFVRRFESLTVVCSDEVCPAR